MKQCLIILSLFISITSFSQQDTADVEAVSRTVNLSEVVVRSGLNVSRFLQLVKTDTTFFKAFKNLRILGFTSVNDIQMLDKRGSVKASLQSKTKQVVAGGCRTMHILEEHRSGDMYSGEDFNYYTAQLYAGLFFTRGRVCGDNNIVKGIDVTVRNKKGIEKHKDQLKMMFFNPGKKIPGIPFIGDKLDIFDNELAPLYDYSIDMIDYNGQNCYVFKIKSKEGLSGWQKDRIVFDNITTWFNAKTMEIVGRDYDLSYNSGVYDFDVHMEVQMTKYGEYLVPQLLRYKGDWDVAFKKREKGLFTAILFDFNK
ncbi:MAG TPA: hypothetical protein VM888_14215 [Chitinophagaceae bacterium]|nr:hypothetical protein [Chitinophagaceae bacterium]